VLLEQLEDGRLDGPGLAALLPEVGEEVRDVAAAAAQERSRK
jgi:hypothetical protein